MQGREKHRSKQNPTGCPPHCEIPSFANENSRPINVSNPILWLAAVLLTAPQSSTEAQLRSLLSPGHSIQSALTGDTLDVLLEAECSHRLTLPSVTDATDALHIRSAFPLRLRLRCASVGMQNKCFGESKALDETVLILLAFG